MVALGSELIVWSPSMVDVFVIVVLGSRRDVLVKEVRSTCTIRIIPVRPVGGVFSVSRRSRRGT